MVPMRTTIDAAGRVVVPKELRERVGLGPGDEIEITAHGGGLHLEPATYGGRIEEQDGHWVIVGSTDRPVSDADVRRIRDAERR